MTADMIFDAAFNSYDDHKDGDYYRGVCYTYGYNVDADLKKAKSSYVEGVKKGNAKCMYGLAVILMKDKKSQKCQEAFSLFSDAFKDLLNQANQNDPASQRMISCYYLFGDRGIEKNLEKAKQWLVCAAENADIEAQINLAHCYENGNAFEQDYQSAKEWYAKAAAQGSYKAHKKLKELQGVKE